MTEKKIAVVTGISSGIGKATALRLVEEGFIVYGGARRVDRLQELKVQGVRVQALDVTDEASNRALQDGSLISVRSEEGYILQLEVGTMLLNMR